MSRIGKSPITVPQGVEVKIDGNKVTVTGPKGTLTNEFLKVVSMTLAGDTLTVNLLDAKAGNIHGLTRTLISNMIVGVSTGFTKTLEINGVGYKAVKQGTKVVLSLGFSHPVEFFDDENTTLELTNPTTIVVKGIDKQIVGQVAANIRKTRPPEPYKGKGIKYAGEKIVRKEGKASGKK